jgi:hypothetical protein
MRSAVRPRPKLGEPPLPTPTDAIPGSPEKIAIMRSRLDAGQEIHHPRDEKRDGQCYTFNSEFVSLNDLFEALRERFGQRSDVE